ncbi:MAG: hypothetical protein AAGI23_21390 [Bacteroidota bacterium]
MNDATFLQYKQFFYGWAQKHWSGIEQHIKEEVFLDALAIYVEYDRQGKVTVKPTTFIISVAHRKFQQLRKGQTQELKKDVAAETNELPIQKELVRTALKQLDEKCKAILTAKYFYNASMEDIMQETGAKSRAVVRTQKKRCIRKLKAIVVEMQKAA